MDTGSGALRKEGGLEMQEEEGRRHRVVDPAVEVASPVEEEMCSGDDEGGGGAV